jgi:hypothetical protein
LLFVSWLLLKVAIRLLNDPMRSRELLKPLGEWVRLESVSELNSLENQTQSHLHSEDSHSR